MTSTYVNTSNKVTFTRDELKIDIFNINCPHCDSVFNMSFLKFYQQQRNKKLTLKCCYCKGKFKWKMGDEGRKSYVNDLFKSNSELTDKELEDYRHIIDTSYS